MNFTIRRKITLSFLILAIVMSSVFALTSYFRIINAMHEEVQKHGLQTVKILSKMAGPYIFESDYITIIDLAQQLINDGEIRKFTVIDSLGKTWLTTHPREKTLPADDAFYAQHIKGNAEGFRRISGHDIDMMEFVYPILALGKVRYLLKIELSLERIQQQAIQRIRENIIIGVIMLFVAGGISLILAKLLTTPLQNLVQGTLELSRGNLAHRIKLKSTDETGLLSDSFNTMAENLEQELADRKRADSKLQEYNTNLENTVSERTSMLTLTNEKLSAEIDERSKIENALMESKDRYRRFSEVTLNAIVFHSENTIVDVNLAFTKIFDLTIDELKGRNLLDIICQPENLQDVRNTFSSSDEHFIETIAVKRDGTTIHIELQNRPLAQITPPMGVASIRDITDRKKLEEQLQQAQRMEGIGRLAAGIAHDLNNILSGIVTMPQLLLLGIAQDSPIRDSLQLIQKSGENAAVIVQDMLTIAGNRLTMETILDPTVLIRSFIVSPESMKLMETHPGIRINLKLCDGLQNIKGSPVHLSQAVMNLVKNAADAIEGEGEIVIAVNDVTLRSSGGHYETIPSGNYACISVKDSGLGIPPEKIPFIFEPFYTKKALGRTGTGLGMVIVWNTVKEHKGYIDIISNVGSGTDVMMYFPSTQEVNRETVDTANFDNLHGNGEFILIVDDIEEQRKVATSILEKLNYRVGNVSGGLEALEFLNIQKVDLILMDMLMEPGINGLDTSKRVLTRYPDAKIIIASGYAENEMVLQTLELGAKQYLKKPYSIEALGLAVKNHLM